MAFKPNYNQQRAERNRLKQAKKDAKLREKENAREHQKLAAGNIGTIRRDATRQTADRIVHTSITQQQLSRWSLQHFLST